jgi:hypothetical protein
MNKRRQRRLAAAMVLVLVLAGCSQPAPQPVATAVAQAQATGVSVQATAQPIATRVAGALTQLQPTDVGRLIGTTMGASIEITLTPPNGPNDQVTQATLTGTDRSGAFGRLDKQARVAFANAGFQLARQAYPRAQLDLHIVDTNGTPLLDASYPPGGSPTYQ